MANIRKSMLLLGTGSVASPTAPAPRPLDTLKTLVKDGQALSPEAALEYFSDQPVSAPAVTPPVTGKRRPLKEIRHSLRTKHGEIVQFNQKIVAILGIRLILSVNEALILKRLLAKRRTCVSHAELSSEIAKSSYNNVLSSLKKKVTAGLPLVKICNIRSQGYLLLFPGETPTAPPEKKKPQSAEEENVPERRRALEQIKLSEPVLSTIRSVMLEANGKGVSAHRFPGGYRSSNMIRKWFRKMRSEVIEADSAFEPCFIARRGFGYAIDLRRYGS